jgi:hypothetical protein
MRKKSDVFRKVLEIYSEKGVDRFVCLILVDLDEEEAYDFYQYLYFELSVSPRVLLRESYEDRQEIRKIMLAMAYTIAADEEEEK